MAQLKDYVIIQPKSRIKAGEGLNKGEYKFFTSSNTQSKWLNQYQYDKPALIFGTGGMASVHFCDTPFSTSTDCIVMYANGNLNLEYVYRYLESHMYILENGFKGVGLKHISKEYILSISIPEVDLYQQESLIASARKIDEIIYARQNQLTKVDELVKSRFVEMFGSIHDERFELKSLPEIVVKDKDSIKRGPFGGALKKDDFVETGYLVYEQRHAIHNDFEYEKYYITKEKYDDMIGFKVIPGDLIISCSGVTLGRIAEVPKGAKEGIINQALLKLSLNQTIMKNTFFIHQFRSKEIQEILFGFSRGSGIPNMPSMSEVKTVKFICPPIELQEKFVAFVEQTDKSKFAVQQSLDKLETLKKSLMQKYFG